MKHAAALRKKADKFNEEFEKSEKKAMPQLRSLAKTIGKLRAALKEAVGQRDALQKSLAATRQKEFDARFAAHVCQREALALGGKVDDRVLLDVARRLTDGNFPDLSAIPPRRTSGRGPSQWL